MILMLVLATTMVPSVSHAMAHRDPEIKQTAAAKAHDCHKHGAEKSTQNNNCCDKGACTCIGGTCHNGLSKIFNNDAAPLHNLTTNQNVFDFTNEHAESALAELLKRPPKA